MKSILSHLIIKLAMINTCYISHNLMIEIIENLTSLCTWIYQGDEGGGGNVSDFAFFNTDTLNYIVLGHVQK